MFLSKLLHPNGGLVAKLLRYYSSSIKTSHYEVLRVARDSTDKEIKEAFIRLSKEYHPDINKTAHAQEHFVRIVEAYNVLSKPSTRAQYDSISVHSRKQHNEFRYAYRTSNPYSSRYNHARSNYYDLRSPQKGYRRVPNYILLTICFGIAIVGTFLQVIIIRDMYAMNKQKANERSKRLSEELEKVRAAAKNGNEAQTRMLLEKIVAAANPTIATASLGQTLADEKK